MSEQFELLLVDDDIDDVKALQRALETDPSVRLTVESSLESACARLKKDPADVVLLDLAVASDVARVQQCAPHAEIIVFTDATDPVAIRLLQIQHALESLRLTRELEKRMERIEASEAQLRSIIQATADALVIVDVEGVVKYANAAAAELFGHTMQDLIEHPFGFPLVAGETTELDIVRKNLSPVVAELRVVAATWNRKPAFIASLRDITARKRAELHAKDLIREQMARAQAEHSEQRARYLAEAANVLGESFDYNVTLVKLANVCVVYLCDWCIIDLVEANHMLKRVAVSQTDETKSKLGRELGELSPEQDPMPREPEALRSRHGFIIDDWQTDNPSRSPHYREVMGRVAAHHGMVVPLCSRDQTLGVMTLISTDARRRYSDLDLALAAEVARAAANAVDNSRLFQEAQRGNEAKSNFLAVMSHELRTPLNAIIGYSDLLLMGIPRHIDPHARDHVDRIRGSAKHLLRLIEQILTFSRMDARKERVEFETTSVHRVIEEVTSLIKPMADEKKLDFEAVRPGSDYSIRTDSGKLEQILLNLLSNAVKFTPGGSVKLDVVPTDGWTQFHVRDSGVGIPDEHLERIFDPFWQVEQGRTRQAEGTGLGLSVARRLAELLGGNLVVQSTVGLGSTFTLQIPNDGPASN